MTIITASATADSHQDFTFAADYCSFRGHDRDIHGSWSSGSGEEGEEQGGVMWRLNTLANGAMHMGPCLSGHLLRNVSLSVLLRYLVCFD